jgi:hypothetical protein
LEKNEELIKEVNNLKSQNNSLREQVTKLEEHSKQDANDVKISNFFENK